MNYEPMPLVLDYVATDIYCQALKEVSQQGSHSRCLFGNLAKVEAQLSDDPNWHAPRVKFMPEQGVIHFNYARSRYEQQLTQADIRWLDRFDAGLDVRSRRITLDPNGPHTRPLREVGSANGGAPQPRTAAQRRNTPAERGSLLPSMPPRSEAVSEAEVRDQAARVTTQPAPPRSRGTEPPRPGKSRTIGCDTKDGGNSGRARRMRVLSAQRVEAAGRRQAS